MCFKNIKQLTLTGAVFLVFGVGNAGVNAQDMRQGFQAIQLCDQLASHADDPEAFASGVPDDQLDAQRVIEACEAAEKIDKKAPRLSFQLARGYLKMDRLGDAIEALLRASQQGHGAALAYLGDIHLDGAPGIEPDPVVAHGLYTRALQSGFEPARKILAEFEDHTEKFMQAENEESAAAKSATSGVRLDYINPDIIENLLRGDLDEVTNNEAWVKEYLLTIAETISEDCQAHFNRDQIQFLQTASKLTAFDWSAETGWLFIFDLLDTMKTVRNGYAQGKLIIPGIEARLSEEANMKQLVTEAVTDAYALMGRHSCKSQELHTFSRNLVAYIENQGAPRAGSQSIMGACTASQVRSGRRDASSFCLCITRKLTFGAAMSRQQRKLLTTDYYSGAQTIIRVNKDHFRSCF